MNNIKIRGIRNIRGLAFTNINNIKMKPNMLIRSCKLSKASKKNRCRLLSEYNIKTIIDLRNQIEIDEDKKFEYPENINYHHIPVLNNSYFGITHEKHMRSVLFKEGKKFKDDGSHLNYMTDMYKSIVFDEYSKSQFKIFFDLLLNRDSGVILFHCAGGKDRTGIAAMFILTILGVSKDDIINDYCQSDINNKRHNSFLSFWIRLLIPFKGFKRILIEMLHARKEFLLNTIKAIEEKYDSIINYLENELGIDSNKQNILRNIYLEN